MTTPFKLRTLIPNKQRIEPFELFAPHCLDSYKLGHIDQYPDLTEFVMSNFTPRSNAHLNVPAKYKADNKYVVWGTLGAMREIVALWDKTFFSQPKEKCLARYKARVPAFTGKETAAQHLADLHDLGFLPIRVKLLSEGSRVNIGVPFMTIVNTLPNFFWLTNALETFISNEIWKPLTTATIGFAYRQMLDDYAEITGSPKDFVLWQGHDFADRGMSGMMDAAKSGAGHNLSFFGSDSVSAFDWLDFMYNVDGKEFLGGSVAASEHSVMTVDGTEGELEVIRRLITKVNPEGVVSFVADTYDFWKVLMEYAPLLKDDILARKPNALGLSKVVFRPDSGDPVLILTGMTYVDQNVEDLTVAQIDHRNPEVLKIDGKYYEYEITVDKYEGFPEDLILGKEVPEWVVKGAVECLWDIFGGELTPKGYKAVMQRVGLIYGDSITPERCLQILQRLEAKGFASCNVVLGIGSFTYQYITRDTLGMAIKGTFAQIDGRGVEMMKNPKTDSGVKKSARGLLKVLKSIEASNEEKYILVDQVDWDEEDTGELELALENGHWFMEPDIGEARRRLFGN